MPHGYVHRALYTLAALVAVGICVRGGLAVGRPARHLGRGLCRVAQSG